MAETNIKTDTQLGDDIDLNCFQSLKILVVDDVLSNRELMAGYFDETIHHLCYAEDGLQALEMVRAEKPDLIFLDLRMPKMTGEEVARSLKANLSTKDIPIIFMSAAIVQEEKKFLNHLSEGLVSKPVSQHQIVQLMKTIFPIAHQPLKTHSELIALETKAECRRSSVNFDRERAAFISADEPLSDELLKKLDIEQEQVWPQLQKTMIWQDIREFIDRLESWAVEYQSNTLLTYARLMEDAYNNFNLEKLEKTIKQFPDIRETIAKNTLQDV